jgi:hypothetical protein
MGNGMKAGICSGTFGIMRSWELLVAKKYENFTGYIYT